jgi:hypothetical protein
MIWRFTLINRIPGGDQLFFAARSDVNLRTDTNQVVIRQQDNSHNIQPGMIIHVNDESYTITSVFYSSAFREITLYVSETIDSAIYLSNVNFEIDYGTALAPHDVEIDEPIGWDALSMVLQRDNDWHGIAPQFSTSNLQFEEKAYWILKEEYENAGVDGNIGIRIEWGCDDCDCYKPFFEGKIDFASYQENCEEECYITAGVLEDSPISQLKNRGDTDVDLTSNIAYDGKTLLSDYTGLNKEIQVPSKAILVKTQAQNDVSLTSANLSEDAQWFANTGGSPQMRAQILPGFTKTLYTDIATSTIWNDINMINGGFQGVPAEGLIPLIDFQQLSTNLQCETSEIEIEYRYKGNVAHAGGSFATSPQLQFLKLPNGKDPTEYDSYEKLQDDALIYGGSGFDISKSFTTTFEPGDKFWLVHFIFVNDPDSFTDFTVTEDPECFIDIHLKSICESSPSITYLIHESASRLVENITNGAMMFKSQYYGRTDSEPFSYDIDGCGGLRALTNGLQLRRAILADGSDPKVFTSWENFLNSQNAIDHIGFCIEQLPNTDKDFPNAKVVRCEPVQYFYKPSIVFIADGVNAYTKKIKTDRIWNQFNFGFDKYETESTNGLDAIHTKRQYRIPIQNSDISLEKTCKYIADGYATEATRRLFGTTQDWRYDQEIFMLCLTREGDLKVEQGNIDSASNLFDPATVINYRISPIRNAMRWFNWLEQGIRKPDPEDTKFIFNSGDGNYVAKGKLQGDACVNEENAIAENDALFENQFNDEDAAKPFMVPEEVNFTFPLGLNEFLFLKENIYGIVQYRRDADDPWKFGWIDKLEPHHEDGDATFTLVTALGISAVNIEDYILTESGLVITTEAGIGLTEG